MDFGGNVRSDEELRNFDAEFCGIHQEEVELLWNMGEEYLRNVNIVPIRPCVSTMAGS